MYEDFSAPRVQPAMDSSDLNLEELFDTSRFDYSKWMQRAAGEDDSCGSAAIQSLVSTFDIFSQIRTNFASDGATSSYGMFNDPIDGLGRNFDLENASRPVFESAPTDIYEEREEELDDGRMALRESYESTCINYDDVADNFQAEGIDRRRSLEVYVFLLAFESSLSQIVPRFCYRAK